MAAISESAVEFSTSVYRSSHGASPRGRGTWGFCPEGNQDRGDYLDSIFWAPHGTFSEAKKAARKHFAALGIWRVEVCS